jgi:1-acyl-sn-glycerol-3-phosphate acyltransferase
MTEGRKSGTQAPVAADVGLTATVLATLSGNLYLVLGSVLFGSLAILLAWVPPPGAWVYRMARWWSRGLLLFSGVRVDGDFMTELDSGQRYIFMSNHQGLYDIPALIVTLPGQTRFLAKRSLFQIPVFGWALKAGGFISIDRENRSRASESFSEAVRRLSEGASAMVFPEGSRSLDGELLPFERGGFLLALKSGLPIVPVGIRGSLEVRRRGSRVVRPGRITIHYGRSLGVDAYGVRGRDELMHEVRQRIAQLVELEAR